MMEESQLADLSRRIAALGIAPELADEYASLIGDIPMIDHERGEVIVPGINGQEPVSLPLSVLGDPEIDEEPT